MALERKKQKSNTRRRRAAMPGLDKVGVKLALALGLLLCLFTVAVLVSLLQVSLIRPAVREITEVEEPTSRAVLEMEINAIGTAFEVLGYLHDRDPLHLARIRDDTGDFAVFQRQYHDLEQDPEDKETGVKIDQVYVRLRDVADALVRYDDQQAWALEILLQNLEDIDDLLDDSLQASLQPDDPQAYRKLKAALEMEINANGIAKGLGNFLGTHDPQHEARVLKDKQDFQEYHQAYLLLPLSPQEQQWAGQLGVLFDGTVDLAEQIISLDKAKEAGIAEVVRLHREIDYLLDEVIQIKTRQDLADTTAAVDDSLSRLRMLLFGLILAGLAAGAVAVVAITGSVTRPMGRLVAASQRVAAGDLSVRLNMDSRDEFRVLGDSFDLMVTARQEAEAALRQAHGQLELRVQERTAELAQANKTLGAFNGIVQAITSSLDIGQVYEKFAQEVKKLVDFDRITINSIDRDTNTFTFRFVSGITAPGFNAGSQFPLQGTQTEMLLRSGQCIIRPDIAAGPIFRGSRTLLQLGLCSSILVPLSVQGQVIGVLSLQSCRAGTYGSKEQDILERLAVQIAPTLRHAQLYQDLEGRTAELAQANETITAMNELSRIITATPDIGAVYEQFAQAVKKLMDFERISINSVNRDEGVFTFQHVSGLTAPGRNPGDSMPLAGSQMEKAILSGQHQVRHDITVESSGSAVATMVGVGVRSSILVPLIVNGEVIGGLALWSRRPNAYGAREQETLQRLARQIAPSIQNARLFEDAQRETQRAAAALAQLHAVLEGVDAGIVLVGEDNQTVLWGNRRMGEFLGAEGLGTPAGAGITESDLRRLAEPMLDNPAEFLAGIDRIYQDRERTEVIENVQFKGPHPRVFRLFTTPVYGGSGSYLGRLWVATDVTEQQHLESQVRQSQKMDTVGRLAGGVAHDFNNLLTAILGYAQLGIAGLPQEHPSAGHFKEVEKAAQRAANLTSQLLAFSRHQAVEAIEVDLNHLVMEMHPMLRRLIGDSVELVTLPDSNLPLVKVDHGQMEQVVMNLVVNARDAMPHGGKITIQTVSLTLDARDAAQIPGAAPGHYALLTVADTGTGMTQEVKDHLFEPFFTTKGVSQGTGLGLATCHGIVRRAKGHIQVESQLGRGSTLRIYLPAVACKGSDSTKDAREDGQPRGTETVLVVDDEAALRAVVSQTLGGLGYSVLEARDGFEARRVSQAYPREPIQLLVTDLVMPNMGGIEVASRFKADFPEGKVLFISGYSEDPLLAGASGREDTDFLQKPFMPGTLARKVRDLLDRQPASTVPEALHG